MRGILHFLTGESEVAAELRDRFIFKIVPMLNPGLMITDAIFSVNFSFLQYNIEDFQTDVKQVKLRLQRAAAR